MIGSTSSDRKCYKQPHETRSHLIFLVGKDTSRIRHKAFKEYAKDPDVFTPEELEHDEYMCAMADSGISHMEVDIAILCTRLTPHACVCAFYLLARPRPLCWLMRIMDAK